MKVYIKNNIAGDQMNIKAIHDKPNTIGVYLKLEGFISTNTYDYKMVTSPYFYSVSTYTNGYYVAYWTIGLPRNLVPTFKSRNISAYYEINIIIVQVKKKIEYSNKVEIVGNNFDCQIDLQLCEFNNEFYYTEKKKLCKILFQKLKMIDTSHQNEFNSAINNIQKLQNEDIDIIDINKFDFLNSNETCKLNDTFITNSTIDNLNKYEKLIQLYDTLNIKKINLEQLPHFKLPNIIRINKTPKRFKIQNDNELVAIIEFLEILEHKNTFKLLYINPIKWTSFSIIEEDYQNKELIDMTIIKYEKWNSEYCLEKVFDIIFEDYNNDILTISCNIFQKKHFIILNLDDFEIKIPIKIAGKNSIIEYYND